jgi:hypothetical protein
MHIVDVAEQAMKDLCTMPLIKNLYVAGQTVHVLVAWTALCL